MSILGIFSIMGSDSSENTSHARANTILHHEQASSLFLDPSDSSVVKHSKFPPQSMDVDTPFGATFRSPGEQDHSPYDGVQSCAGPWIKAQSVKYFVDSGQEEADLRSSTTLEGPFYPDPLCSQSVSDSVMPDTNWCFVCSAQFSTLDKLHRQVCFYQVGIRSISD